MKNTLRRASFDKLRRWSETRGISVHDMKMRKNVALCVPHGAGYAVALDEARLGSEANRRCALAHELGHCETGFVYTPRAGRTALRRAEHRANRWAASALLPRDALLAAMREGDTEVWQLAERFGVTEELVRFAMYEYFDIS